MKLFSFFSLASPFVLAQEWSESATKGEAATIQDLTVIVQRILNIAVHLAGIAAFIMLIVGGFQFLTAGGDSKKTQAASSTITFAIFGLVAVIAAWFILLFIYKFTGVDVTKFDIPDSRTKF
ncbi:pilin [Patescibacteria group bacterium]|nr:pilin [Patescibacteria group bacterium]